MDGQTVRQEGRAPYTAYGAMWTGAPRASAPSRPEGVVAAYAWENGWEFRRLADGTVQLVRHSRDWAWSGEGTVALTVDLRLPPAAWAALVAALGTDGQQEAAG